ncbi:unknown [Crocosphaera subtropica ATCC 51142]|uniref:Nitroreductase domain-containing protein n=1 Tax=Crocosphaera subtropica (strain ATCC 51142 / BH68) TaxID=43989 RepID=B1WVB2_CROS5|nr:nitroreductase family protein [Crocosphaera subtropica]ACB53902.1 unknown [Crocosphaera subtropica ATCC 51142]
MNNYQSRSNYHHPLWLRLSPNQMLKIAKSILSKTLPSHLKKKYYQWQAKNKPKPPLVKERLLENYTYDFERFYKFSTAKKGSNLSSNLFPKYSHLTQTNLKALITKDYHRIEKGLALKEPRIGFGKNTVNNLMAAIEQYQTLYGSDELVQISINTLLAYYQFNYQQGHDNKQLYEQINSVKDKIIEDQKISEGGTKTITKKDIWKNAKQDLKNFFATRHSIRHFSNEEVDLSLIKQAVEMAQKTPSVCNRQTSQVYVFSEFQDKQKVLSFQNGNRGFGEQASKVLIVTSNLQNFTSVGERNQCWIDGGMYAMSLVYALHSLGLGTCCLNWSVEHTVDQQLREAVGINDSQAVIMMIAVGHLPDELKVAQSPRKKIEEVLIIK